MLLKGGTGLWKSSSTNQALGTQQTVRTRSLMVLWEPGVKDEPPQEA